MRALLVLGAMLLSSLVTLWVAPLLRGSAPSANASLPAQHAASTSTEVASATPPASTAPAGQSCLSEAELRRIVREELAPLIAGLAGADGAKSQVAAARSEADNKRQLDLVTQQLDRYIRDGVISDADMASLQIEIGKLDNAGRHEMLSKLVGAINSGTLHGRL
jgi:hypothetical protein